MDILSLETAMVSDLDRSVGSMISRPDVQATGVEGNEGDSEESPERGRAREVRSIDCSYSPGSNFARAWYLSDRECRASPSLSSIHESCVEILGADQCPVDHISDADINDEDPISAAQKKRNGVMIRSARGRTKVGSW